MRLSDRLDEFIGAAFPRWAVARKLNRLRGHQIDQLATYAGAKSDRAREGWTSSAGSADSDLSDSIDKLRTRSRQLVRDDGNAAGLLETLVDNVVGEGYRPESCPRIEVLERRLGRSVSEGLVEDWQGSTEAAHERWAPQADVRGVDHIDDITCTAVHSAAESGDCGIKVVMRNHPSRHYSLSLELVEADRIEDPPGNTTDQWRMGVKLAKSGAPIAYNVLRDHPGDKPFGTKHTVVQRYTAHGRLNFMLLFFPKRPGQNRGVPILSPSLTTFDGLSQFMEATIMQARTSACFAGFIKRTNPWDVAPANATRTEDDGQRVEIIEPGMLEYLEPGEDVEFANPQQPSTTFDMFVMRILRIIGNALGMPYELVAKDFSQSNFHSARGAIIEARRGLRRRTQYVQRQFRTPVWELLQREAYLRGDHPRVPATPHPITGGPVLDPEWLRVRWVPISPQGYIDPMREASAQRERIEVGTSSVPDEAAQQGKDWRQVLLDRKRVQRFKERHGIEDPQPAQPPAVEQDQDGDDTAPDPKPAKEAAATP